MLLYDVIIIVETWLNDQISDVELALYNFNIFRANRSIKTSAKYRAGGILIAVRRDICASIIFSDQLVESRYLKLPFNGFNVIVGGVYIPTNSEEFIYKSHCDDLESIFRI